MTDAAARFELVAVAHLFQPWGQPARDLDQLRGGIASAPIEVLFNHTVQYQLRHAGTDELPPDDLSAWVGAVVQDRETAERLSFAVQTRNASARLVRAAVLEVLDALPVRQRTERDAPEGSEFVFLSATSVAFPAGMVVHGGEEAVEALIGTDPGVWFYHLIEEPWFLEGRAPLLDWLATAGEQRLAGSLRDAAGAGLPIEKARRQVLRRWQRSRIVSRVAGATASPDDVRRETGRQVMARFVRRTARSSRPS